MTLAVKSEAISETGHDPDTTGTHICRQAPVSWLIPASPVNVPCLQRIKNILVTLLCILEAVHSSELFRQSIDFPDASTCRPMLSV